MNSCLESSLLCGVLLCHLAPLQIVKYGRRKHEVDEYKKKTAMKLLDLLMKLVGIRQFGTNKFSSFTFLLRWVRLNLSKK